MIRCFGREISEIFLYNDIFSEKFTEKYGFFGSTSLFKVLLYYVIYFKGLVQVFKVFWGLMWVDFQCNTHVTIVASFNPSKDHGLVQN